MFIKKQHSIQWNLIVKKIQEQTNEEENQIFQNWYDTHENNRVYFEKAKSYFKRYYTGNEERIIDKERAWLEFLEHTQKKQSKLHISGLVKYAAIFLLSLLSSWFVYRQFVSQKEKNITIAQQEILPGETKAILILGSGKEIFLDSKITPDFVAQENNVVINHSESGLFYDMKKDSVEKIINNTLIIPRGGEYNVTLSDGTKVTLNSDSKLIFPVRFSGKERKIHLDGEAYFQVAHNEKQPFIVATHSGDIVVLGTEFNLSAYPDDNTIKTTLVKGSVAFSLPSEQKKHVITLGEQIIYNKVDHAVVIHKVNPDIYCCWRDGKFIIESERLEDIMKRLARWYNVDIFFQNAKAKELVFTGDLEKYEKCDIILDIIKLTTNVDFELKGRTIIVK